MSQLGRPNPTTERVRLRFSYVGYVLTLNLVAQLDSCECGVDQIVCSNCDEILHRRQLAARSAEASRGSDEKVTS